MATVNQIGLALSGVTGTGTFVGATSPTLVTPRTAQINDTSGNAMFALNVGGSANSFQFINAAASNAIKMNAIGSDTDVTMRMETKGAGKFDLVTGALTQPLTIRSGTSGGHLTNFVMANTAASRDVTFPDAAGTLLMTGQAISTVPSIAFSSTSGVIGTTTNDNAPVGSVGQYLSSAVALATTGLTTGVVANITSISITAGDWDISGNIAVYGNASTTVRYSQGAISTVSATFPAIQLISGVFYSNAGEAVYAVAGSYFVVPTLRVSTASTITVYLVVESSFAVSTSGGGGSITARRVR